MRRSDLTADEQRNVRTALKFLHLRCGGWEAVARALGMGETTVTNTAHAHSGVSARMAFLVARLAKVGVDDVLSGRFPAVGACPYCGHVATPEGEVTP